MSSLLVRKYGAGDRIRTYDPIITNFEVDLFDYVGQCRMELANLLHLNDNFRSDSWMALDHACERLTYIPY